MHRAGLNPVTRLVLIVGRPTLYMLQSVSLQIRYKGYKGLVHIDTPSHTYMKAVAAANGLDPSSVPGCDLMLRKSMRKVQGVKDDIFGLVAISVPYRAGYINQQFVLLLSALGVADDSLLAAQAEYFWELQHLTDDPSLSILYLLAEGHVSVRGDLVLTEFLKPDSSALTYVDVFSTWRQMSQQGVTQQAPSLTQHTACC